MSKVAVLSKMFVVFCALALTIASSAYAATFDVVLAKYHGSEMGLLVRGPIVTGDGKRFRDALDSAAAQHPDHRMRMVALDSPGGVVVDALEMARAIYARGLATILPANFICVSACVIVFAGGNQKIFSSAARVGVHGVSQANGEQNVSALATTTNMAKTYAALGVPDGVIGRMVITAPEDVSWLTPHDLALFPNTTQLEIDDSNFPIAGAGLDGMKASERPTVRNELTYKKGYEYGYKNYGGCNDVLSAFNEGIDAWGDLTNGCHAGLEALRRERQTVAPVAPNSLRTTFGPPPPHSPALLREASQFLRAFLEGYAKGASANCQQFNALADVCKAAIEQRSRADAGLEPPLTDAKMEEDYGPKEWLDAYDWSYVHHNDPGNCGVMRTPSQLGCQAGGRDWPRREGSHQKPK